MSQTFIPHLCGGTFFALILEARKIRKKARDKQNGGTDNLTAKDLFAGLSNVLTGEKMDPKGGTLAKCASQYKTCKSSSGCYVPFTERAVVLAFDSSMKIKSPVLYARIKEFIDLYLNRDKCRWLVKALLDTIQKDISIKDETTFEIRKNQFIKKSEFAKINELFLPSFLLSVLHYVVMNAPDAESGRATFEKWFRQSGKNTEWKFCGDIGENISSIEILYEESDTTDEDIAPIADVLGSNCGVPLVVEQVGQVLPDISSILSSQIYMVDEHLLLEEQAEDVHKNLPFAKYLREASSFYNDKKTLLNPEDSCPFYDLYVCNNLKYHRPKHRGILETNSKLVISNCTVQTLEAESKYIIIQGTGGIGKSMMLTHLFLTCAKEYQENGAVPILVTLKDYKESTLNVLDFLLAEVQTYDEDITKNTLISVLKKKKAVLLLDGLDEIQKSMRDNFFADIEAFIKSFQGNTIIISSRPVYNFVAYVKFLLLDIQPLTIDQALALINKIKFWDDEGKNNFIEALRTQLFSSHYQFASNPLLLTIMLMTFSMFGEIPAKMHVFYSKAYETMARLHDATKGSYKRPLYTGLTPEEFEKYYSEFCARTYVKEIFEFDEHSFFQHMEKVINDSSIKGKDVTPRNILKDLTDNLCLMYKEGLKYYFIHRSFQEYFTAYHFAYGFDNRLTQFGEHLDEAQQRSYSDRTFDMLYDMIPTKVEHMIFYPMLSQFIKNWNEEGEKNEYWRFLEDQYPTLYVFSDAITDSSYNSPRSYIYEKMVTAHNLSRITELDGLLGITSSLGDGVKVHYHYEIYKKFLNLEAFDRYPDPSSIPDEVLEETTIVEEDEIPYCYREYFGNPREVGSVTEFEIAKMRKNYEKHKHFFSQINDDDFPLKRELFNVKMYFAKLESSVNKERKSNRLFDD
ncbi:NACHT domain-containing protein [Ruminobacter amylophilus]|nr:NACHT domain-containing protein [Ruminobacter amylophilus]